MHIEPSTRSTKTPRQRTAKDWRPSVETAPCIIARDVMRADPDRVDSSDCLQEVLHRMRSLMVASLPVCNPQGDLFGMISYRDIGSRSSINDGALSNATAGSLAEKATVTIDVGDPVDKGMLQLMGTKQVWVVPVLDGKRLVGVIHYSDLKRYA